MSEADTETKNINVRINTDLLEKIDEEWKKQGYNSRSEFIRQSLRESVEKPKLSPQTLKNLLISKDQAQKQEFVTREEIKNEYLDE